MKDNGLGNPAKDSSQKSDEQIIDLYWQRNEEAVQETDKKYGNYLSAIAYNILADREDGQEVLNDVTPEDAVYAGICRIAEIISNGKAIAGTVYDMLPDEARRALDRVDVIFAKGQAKYESLSGQGRHSYYTFLCKCDLFTSRFSVPPLTGMLVEE